MSAPDAAESRALDAANAVSAEVRRLWMEAHTEGMRDGMEAAALILDGVVNGFREDLTMDSGVRDISVAVLVQLRDQIRFYALQLPDPAPIKRGDGEVPDGS